MTFGFPVEKDSLTNVSENRQFNQTNPITLNYNHFKESHFVYCSTLVDYWYNFTNKYNKVNDLTKKRAVGTLYLALVVYVYD